MMNEQKFALAMVSVAGCKPFAALVVNEQVLAINALRETGLLAVSPVEAGSVRALLERWDFVLPALQQAANALASADGQHPQRALCLPVASVQFHPPVDEPRQVFCMGANYRQHVIGLMVNDPDMRGVGREAITDPAELRRIAEATMDERAAGGVPYAFLRLPDTLTGAHQAVPLPRHITKPDWELELAVVIGRTARQVAAADALSHVAGFAILDDLTARELVFRKDMPAMGADWLQGKNWAHSAPFGPYLVPQRFVPDPYALKIQLRLNGELMQDESTADMVIRIERQIAYLSSIVTLHPGDIIATGSPAGNGSHHGIFLKPGDVLTGEITGLGTQRTACL